MTADRRLSSAPVDQFLTAMWGDGPHSLNWTVDGEWRCRFPNDPADVLDRVDKLRHTDVWIGAHSLRHVPASGRGVLGDIADAIVALHADLDWEHWTRRAADPLPTEHEIRSRFARLDLEVAPSIVVNSGHGLQPWWLLSSPVDRDTAQQLMAQLNQALADVGLVNGRADLPSVLRLPGTFNHKDPDDVVPVAVEAIDVQRRFTPEYLLRKLPAATVSHNGSGGTRHQGTSVTDDMQALVDRLVSEHGGHSVTVMRDGSLSLWRPGKPATAGPASAHVITGTKGDAIVTVFTENWPVIGKASADAPPRSWRLSENGTLQHPGAGATDVALIPGHAEPSPPPVSDRVRTAGQLDLRPAPMLVRGWFPRDEVCVLVGKPAAGKGIVMADVIACASRGDDMANGDRMLRPFSSGVICLPGEDDGNEWGRRLEVAGARRDGWFVVDYPPEQAVSMATIIADVEALAARGVELVVVDSLTGLTNAERVDTNKGEVRSVLDRLSVVARRRHVTIVVLHHNRKAQGDALETGQGNMQIVAAARAQLNVVEERRNDDELPARLFGVSKLNGSRKSVPIGFRIVGKPLHHDDGAPMRDEHGDIALIPCVEWIDDRKFTYADLDAAANGTASRSREDCDAFAADLLSAGPMPSDEFLDHMVKAGGYSKDRARRARQRVAGTLQYGKRHWTFPKAMSVADAKQTIVALDAFEDDDAPLVDDDDEEDLS